MVKNLKTKINKNWINKNHLINIKLALVMWFWWLYQYCKKIIFFNDKSWLLIVLLFFSSFINQLYMMVNYEPVMVSSVEVPFDTLLDVLLPSKHLVYVWSFPLNSYLTMKMIVMRMIVEKMIMIYLLLLESISVM